MHRVPHVPQLSSSVFVSTQPEASVPQQVVPDGQTLGALHIPPSQVAREQASGLSQSSASQH